MTCPLIEFEKVNFSYRNQKVLEDFSFKFQQKGLVAMVGVNGSGKSTLLKLMLGLLKPQSGEVKILGSSAGDFSTKFKVGSALQDIDFPSSEKAEEVLGFVKSQYTNSRPLTDLIEMFQLHEFRRKACGQLSGGMKRRLALACAFAGNPHLVLLDEPTTGLDHESRDQLMKNFKHYQQQNNSMILMISHHPEEAIESVDEFLHVKNRKIEKLSTENMKISTGLRKIKFQLKGDTKLPSARHIDQKDDQWEIVTENSDDYIASLVKNSIPFENLTIDKLNAEELLGEFL